MRRSPKSKPQLSISVEMSVRPEHEPSDIQKKRHLSAKPVFGTDAKARGGKKLARSASRAVI